MVVTNIQWMGVFLTCLSLVSMCQIIFSLILSVSLPDILTLIGCQYSTGMGLIAGFITFPTSVRMKTSQLMAMVVCGTLHFSATATAIVTIVIIYKNRSNIGVDFLKLMRTYHEKFSSKLLVDNVQFILQCCGASSNMEWYQIREYGYLQDPFDDGLSVPFSCCSKYSEQACYLHDPSSPTISSSGCVAELENKAILLLWIEISLSGSCFIIEEAELGDNPLKFKNPLLQMAVFLSLKKPSSCDNLRSSSSTIKTVYKRSKWGDFSNSTKCSKREASSGNTTAAELCPSLHSEVYISHKGPKDCRKITWNK